jgi:hypothetical protein
MLTYVKLGAALALLAAFAWGAIADYHAGKKAGQDAVQTAWDANKLAIAEATAKAIQAVATDKETALANNGAVINDLQAQTVSLRGLNSSLAQRLRIATHPTTDFNTVSEGGDIAGSPTGAANDRVGQIDDSLAATLTECAVNRANYKALIAQVKPQCGITIDCGPAL